MADHVGFLTALELGITSSECNGDIDVACSLELGHPLFSADEEDATMTLSDGLVVSLDLPPDLDESLDDLVAWAEEDDPVSFGEACSVENTACGAHVAALSSQDLTEKAEHFLGGVANSDLSSIVEMVEAQSDSPYSTDQMRNAFRFAALSGWMIPEVECDSDDPSTTLVVSCLVSSAHPLFSGAETTWSLTWGGGSIVDADVVPHETISTAYTDLYQWAMQNHSGSSAAVSGLDKYDPSEIVTGISAYALNDRCGRHLQLLVGDYLVDTDPDHLVALTWQIASTFNARDIDAQVDLFAPDGTLFAAQGLEDIGSSRGRRWTPV